MQVHIRFFSCKCVALSARDEIDKLLGNLPERVLATRTELPLCELKYLAMMVSSAMQLFTTETHENAGSSVFCRRDIH